MSDSPKPVDLSFIPVDEELVKRWDREWCRYFSRYHGQLWFDSLADVDERVERFRSRLPSLTTEELFHYELFSYETKSPLSIWLNPNDLLSKHVAEIGCGPGQLGKQLGHVVSHYLGIDFSRLALSVARLISPARCDYLNLGDLEQLGRYCGTRDLVLGRHFFIHQNAESAQWVTRLAHALLKPDGLLIADFYFPNAEGKKRVADGRVQPARAAWDPAYPSRMFLFEEREIQEIAARAGFRIESEQIVEPQQRRFVRLRKTV